MLDHPLVIETGETFLTDAQMIRFIRERCGDSCAEYLTTRIETDEMPLGGTQFLRRLKESLMDLSRELDDVETVIDKTIDLIEDQKGMRN